MKQKEIAGKLGITANYMSLVENGKREPSISFLKRLGVALGVPVGLFFLWEQPDPKKGIEEARDLLTKMEAMYVFSQRGKTQRRRVPA